MQPTYLPWSGYLALIDRVDVFVFLDDVQFSRETWQSQNRILLHGNEHYLEVPTVYAPLKTSIQDILVDDIKPWRRRHIETLKTAYELHPTGPACIDVIELVLERNHTHLADVNIFLIEALCDLIGIRTSRIRASELRCGGRRSNHVALICRAVGCDQYLSPPGAREYLVEDNFEEESLIKLSFLEFDPKPYTQIGGTQFASHLSVVDLIANLGAKAALGYLRGVD
jgi:hypothetical protein